MFNFLGKSLVLAHTALSLLLMTWAAGLYFAGVDWGWANPRVELDQRIASEFDKAAVVFGDSVKMRDRAVAGVPAARASLRQAELQFPQNHLFYAAEIERLRNAPGETIEVKSITSAVNLDKKLGKPVLDRPEEVNKSYRAYLEDLKKVQGEVDKVEQEIRQVLDESKKVTYQLTGRDDAGVKKQHGLYDLIDLEFQTQKQLKEEREYLRPQWSQTVGEAQRAIQRRNNLERTLGRLEEAAKQE